MQKEPHRTAACSERGEESGNVAVKDKPGKGTILGTVTDFNTGNGLHLSLD